MNAPLRLQLQPIVSLVICLILMAPVLRAANGTWSLNSTGGAWDVSTNWASSIVADGDTSTAFFNNLNLTSDIALTLGVDRVIRNVTFGDTTPSNHSWAISGNTLTLSGGSSRTITVGDLGTGTATINSVLAGSGISKAGVGTLVLSGENTFTGNFSITGGKVIADWAKTPTANLVISNGSIFQASASGSASGALSFAGAGGTFDTKGFNVTTGRLAPNGSGTFTKAGTGTLTIGAHNQNASVPNITVSEGTLRAGVNNAFYLNQITVSSGALLDLNGFTSTWTAAAASNNSIGLSGAGNVTTTAGGTLFFNYGNFSGDLQQGNLLVYGRTATTGAALAGTLTLSGTNAYAGTTTVNDASTLIITGSTANSSSYTINAGGKLQVGNHTTTGTLSAGSVANAGTLEFARSNALTFANAITGAGTVIQSGAGITTLGSKAYTGVTRITGGTLSAMVLANGGTASSVGASANAASNLILNGGILQYTGGAVSTDRLFSVGTSGGTLDASGSGAVNFTNAGSLGFNAQTGPRTLTLTGNNGGNNTLAAVIGDNSGATSLVKSSVGAWVLTGANTYTGTTTVSGGTLVLSGPGSIAGSTTVDVQSGATLNTTALGTHTFGIGQTVKGRGTILGNTVIQGTLAPGSSPGILSFSNDLTLATSANSIFEIQNTGWLRGTDYDGVDVGALLTYNGTLTLTLTSWVTDGTYDLFSFGSVTGNFSAVTFSGGIYAGAFTENSGIWSAADTNGSGQIFSFDQATGDLIVSAIPEPSTVLLLAGGLMTRLFRRRFRANRGR